MQNDAPRTPGTIIFQLKLTQNAIHSLQCLNHAKCATWEREQIMQSLSLKIYFFVNTTMMKFFFELDGPRTPGTIIFQLKITQNAIHSLQWLNHVKCTTRGRIMQSMSHEIMQNVYHMCENHAK